MDNMIKFIDSTGGHIYLPDGAGKKFLKTKDSKSKSGHSLVAQIEMTHSGIVTGNYGFYLPSNMQSGAHSFVKDYNKPVLVGHDSDSDPVGRVIAARYVDSMSGLAANDKYLAKYMNFKDAKSKNQADDLVDFAQYVMGEYAHKDSYRGLGHILGTFKISDEETIAKILDERYLTVSTAMVSDAARCSECGQDWIQDGQCEHSRGSVYDSGIPVVIIPGSQTYSHVGIVSEPADQFAAGFSGIEIIKDNVVRSLENVQHEFSDKFAVAASLFSYNNTSLISLSDETKTDLIEVKDNIQQIENSLKSMENVNMKKFTDQIEATISLWKNSDDEGSTSVRISKYVCELTPEELAELSKKAMAALDSKEFEDEGQFKDALAEFVITEIPAETRTTEVEGSDSEGSTTDESILTDAVEIVMTNVKVLDEKFKLVKGPEYDTSLETKVLGEINEIEDANLTKKEAKELAKLIVRSQHGDSLATLTLNANEKELKDSLEAFKVMREKRFKLATVTEEEVLDKINELLEDEDKVSVEKFSELDQKNCAGTRKYFPVTNAKVADAAKAVLGQALAADSLKGRILGNLEKLSSAFSVKMEDNAQTSQENFDTSSSECDNLEELTDEKLLEDLKGLIKLADERDIITGAISEYLVDKDQEIEILDQQLELANEQIETLEEAVKSFKDEAIKTVAEEIVDAKIAKGWITADSKGAELEEHLRRSEDSLLDMAKDLNKMGVKVVEVVTETPQTEILETIDNPVLQDSSTTVNEQIEEDETPVALTRKERELKKKYNTIKAAKGQAFADSWLNKRI